MVSIRLGNIFFFFQDYDKPCINSDGTVNIYRERISGLHMFAGTITLATTRSIEKAIKAIAQSSTISVGALGCAWCEQFSHLYFPIHCARHDTFSAVICVSGYKSSYNRCRNFLRFRPQILEKKKTNINKHQSSEILLFLLLFVTCGDRSV